MIHKNRQNPRISTLQMRQPVHPGARRHRRSVCAARRPERQHPLVLRPPQLHRWSVRAGTILTLAPCPAVFFLSVLPFFDLRAFFFSLFFVAFPGVLVHSLHLLFAVAPGNHENKERILGLWPSTELRSRMWLSSHQLLSEFSFSLCFPLLCFCFPLLILVLRSSFLAIPGSGDDSGPSMRYVFFEVLRMPFCEAHRNWSPDPLRSA